ncbi:MAG: hypothetical protein GEU81_02965 [Nitriliruptorales bacterium]|nr:hypothetical protein [Nitriliruptorales bacterium]
MGLAPITIGMVGLLFALWANGMQLLGVDQKSVDDSVSEGGSGYAVAIAGSGMGAVTLLFMSGWLVIAAPLGDEGVGAQLGLLFSSIAGMYGLLWLGAAVVQLRGWDMRVIGNVALLCLGLQVIQIGLLASYRVAAQIPLPHFLAVQAALVGYVLVLYGFWAVTHGRISPKVVGWACMLAVVGTLYIMVFGGGLLDPLGM